MLSSFRDYDISLQIVARASQARGYAKTISRPYSVSTYKIDGHGSKREIRDTVEQLLEGARFIYKVNHCPFLLYYYYQQLIF